MHNLSVKTRSAKALPLNVFARLSTKLGIISVWVCCSLVPSLSAANADTAAMEIDAASFDCIRDLTPVRGFFVDNLQGDLEATVAAAEAESGITYPPGSVVQLVPTEAMVKRNAGFNPATKDWEFFELDVSEQGTAIRTRGFVDVVNRFGGNCFACHIQARPEFDLICEQDHGCDPIPVTPLMVKAIQKTDPRCAPVELSADEADALQALQSAGTP